MSENKLKFSGEIVTVELGSRSYPICVGTEILACLGDILVRQQAQPRIVVITDENVARHYGDKVSAALRDAHLQPHLVSVPAGEATKRIEIVQNLYDRLFDLAVERSDTIVALGGGVVGDLAGFVAATFKRGVNYVQIPTSLLAMVDSSIGGKTGINHPRGKNMIGAFYQPRLVFADTATLRTLPKRELGCGLAETVKHAVIRDGAFFGWLEQNAERILHLDPAVMPELVVRNCRIKAAVVSADERESKLRGILNFGHTIGHTLETVLPERDYHHGEAVSLGMVAATRIAVARRMIGDSDAKQIIRLLQAFGLPTTVAESLPTDKLLTAMKQDKKVKAGKLQFVLPTHIGDCTFVDDLSETEIQSAIDSLH